MSNGSEIVCVAPKDIHEAKALSVLLAASALMPSSIKNKASDVLAIVLAGSELGLAPMQAIRGMHVISGKPVLSADLIAALVMRRGDVCEYLTVLETTPTRAVYETKRKGSPAPVRHEFTIQMAEAAGLTGNATYRKFPDAMLRARCVAAICRAVYPDLCFGLYVEGEIDGERSWPEGVPHPAPVQTERAVSIKEQIRSQVVPPAPAKAPEPIEDAEIVEEAKGPTPEEAIAAAKTPADLDAVLVTLRALPPARQAELGPIFKARKRELTPKA